MKRSILIGLAILATGFGACKKCGDHGPGRGNGSGGGSNCAAVICTAVFEEEHLRVQDAAGNPVNLSSFVVTDATGTPLPMSNGQAVYGYPHNGNGKYTVINDAWVSGHQNTSMSVRAKGYINGVQVFDQPYTVAADCCHVSMTGGGTTITVNAQ